MKNKQIANLVSEVVFNANSHNKDFAVQLFVEKVVLPKEIGSYSQQEMEKYILDYLDNKQ